MKALIDGDVLLYRSCWACQKTHYTHRKTGEFFDGKLKARKWYQDEYLDGFKRDKKAPLPDWDLDWDIVEEIEPFKNVKFLLNNYIKEICDVGKAEEYAVYLSPPRNFRHDIAKTAEYKAGRPPPPHHIEEARAHMFRVHKAEVGDNIEADDLLGLNQTTDTFIASVDKDLLMIPGRHYDIVKKTKQIVDLLAADDWFFMQLIMGDKTDNIKGLAGYGPKKAQDLVASYAGDMIGLVQDIEELYTMQYGSRGKDVMIEHAQLVYILRPGDEPGKEQWRKMLLLDEQQGT